MKVQTKILLLVLLVTTSFVGGLFAFREHQHRRLRKLSAERAEERDTNFSKFLEERGDKLKAFVDDTSVWDDLVLALQKPDLIWAAANLREETLTTYGLNAIWVYKPEHQLFYSLNNRFAENLKPLPVTAEALEKLCSSDHPCHFFMHVPQGWMEIRGAPILPSTNRLGDPKPHGYLFAGQIWITDNLKQMAQFTGYTLRVAPITGGKAPPHSSEETGTIRFARIVPGWDGKPIARILAEYDSPLIRELNSTSQTLLRSLLIFAGALLLVLAAALLFWLRRPLMRLAHSLQAGEEAQLHQMAKRRDEFGLLAGRMVEFRRTEEKLHAAEEQLRHAQKLEAVGRLAGGVAHDFNNLLTAIIGYAQLLERKLEHDPIAHEQIRLVFRAGEQAAGLTRQLLAFSRKQILELKVVDLNQIIRDVRRLLERIIGEHIQVVIEPLPGPARVLADPGQIEQVLLNLGVNARDAMPGGGRLVYRTTQCVIDEDGALARGGELAPGRYIALIVTDTGTGMDAETQSQIFEPFFTTKGPGVGTGLGLATVYGIVKQSRGCISVQSEPGKGCTFTIELPLVEDATAPVEEPPAPIVAGEQTENILVVEDEEVVRMVICSVLEQAGYQVLCAGSPAEALETASTHDGSIDLLLTDVIMPGMTGTVLARKLTEFFPEARVLYISGYSERDMMEQGIAEGEIEVLQKPFTHETLLHRVREVLGGAVSA